MTRKHRQKSRSNLAQRPTLFHPETRLCHAISQDLKPFAYGGNKEKGDTLVGITGVNLTNWGNKVITEIREGDETETSVFITSRKRVPIDLTADPDEHEERFLFHLDQLIDERF